ncbi:MAG: hypothetical protein U1F42_09720 [Candidatus Competibacteraceae bacterium]
MRLHPESLDTLRQGWVNVLCQSSALTLSPESIGQIRQILIDTINRDLPPEEAKSATPSPHGPDQPRRTILSPAAPHTRSRHYYS